MQSNFLIIHLSFTLDPLLINYVDNTLQLHTQSIKVDLTASSGYNFIHLYSALRAHLLRLDKR